MRSKIYPVLFVVFAFSSFVLRAQVISTVAGTGAMGYMGDGNLAIHAEFNNCAGVSFDGAGNIYIADRDNNVVRKVNNMGIISTFAGTTVAGYSGDHGAATAAKLNKPTNIVADDAGNVYIADNGNNVVRVVTTTGIISTYAGNGIAGYGGDADSARFAQLSDPQGLAFSNGNLFIADAGNHVIRMVDPTHVIITIMGSGSLGNSGNGGMATDATLGNPTGVAIDVNGSVYVADRLNNVVRKADGMTGIMSTVAGTGLVGYGGDGAAAVAASMQFPSSVSIDVAGNLFIADEGNNKIRKVNAAGIISTIAGINANGYLGDGGPATGAELNSPRDVAVDGWGRIYIADYGNNVIRAITNATAVNTITKEADGLSVYPNPSTGMFTVATQDLAGAVIVVMDVTGKIIETRNVHSAAATEVFDVSDLSAGTYFIKVTAGTATYAGHVSVVR